MLMISELSAMTLKAADNEKVSFARLCMCKSSKQQRPLPTMAVNPI